MNQILRILLPRCEASTRLLLSSFGTSGLLHALVGAALATWLGAMAPHLFPPRQGFNSIQLTASQQILVDEVPADAADSVSMPVEFVVSEADESLSSPKTLREPVLGSEPMLSSPNAFAPNGESSVNQLTSSRATHSELPPTSPPLRTVPRTPRVVPPAQTQSSVASISSEQDAGQLDAIPTKIYSPQPSYPAEALQQRLQGRVVLRVKITADGTVAATNVLRSSGHLVLDQAARQAVLQWRFNSPRRLGVAVDTEVAVPVRFHIEDQ